MSRSLGHKALLILAVAVTLFVAALYGFMQYRISKLTNQAINDRAALDGDQEKNGTGILSVYQSTTAERTQLESIFIHEENAVPFIEAVEHIGTVAGIPVSLSSIVPVSAENAGEGGIGTLQAHVEARGSWPAVMKTLMLIELLPYRMSVTRVRFDGPDQAASAGVAGRFWRL